MGWDNEIQGQERGPEEDWNLKRLGRAGKEVVRERDRGPRLLCLPPVQSPVGAIRWPSIQPSMHSSWGQILGAAHECRSCRRGWGSVGGARAVAPLYSQCPTWTLAQSGGPSNIWWNEQRNEYALAQKPEGPYGEGVSHSDPAARVPGLCYFLLHDLGYVI